MKWGRLAAFIAAATVVCWFLSEQVTGFWHFLLVWLAFCGLLLEVALVGIEFSNRTRRWGYAIWIAYAGACIGMLLHNMWQLYNPNPLSFTVSRVIQGASEENNPDKNLVLWLATPSLKDPAVYPLAFLVFARFTNHKPTTCMIEGYGLETQATNGVWRVIPSMGLRLKTLYVGVDLHHAHEAEMGEDSFNSVIDRKNIGPEETVEGWLFLGHPKGDFSERLRVRIAETDGSVYVKALEYPKPLAGQGYSAQTASMKIKPEEKNLSGFRMVFSPENMPP